MKVIKHGTKYVLQKSRKKCDFCNCVFEFTQADLQGVNTVTDADSRNLDATELLAMSLFNSSIKVKTTFQLTCSECKHKFKVDDRYSILWED